MSIRTTQDKVKAVLLDNWNGRSDLKIFIRIASRVVDKVVELAAANGESLSSDSALDVETLLAAHKYMMSDRGYRSRSTLSASGAFDGETGKGLDATMFGQMAKDADWTGWLSALTNGTVAGCEWMGLPLSEQSTYAERNL